MSALYPYLLPKDTECCANEDSDHYNIKNYGSYVPCNNVMIINDFLIFGRNTNTFHSLSPCLIKGSLMLSGISDRDKLWLKLALSLLFTATIHDLAGNFPP